MPSTITAYHTDTDANWAAIMAALKDSPEQPTTPCPSRFLIKVGDSVDLLKRLPDNSIDSCVCDPPYNLSIVERWGKASPQDIADAPSPFSRLATGFMGQAWDGTGITFDSAFWGHVLRVLKPGGYLLSFGSPRTSHRMVTAIEDAGFAIRDSFIWLYGSGFPKSKNVALSIDKQAGHPNRGRAIPTASRYQNGTTASLTSNPVRDYEAKTEHGQRWNGWGTGLKPAYEPVVLARKPLDGTVATNVLNYGTGALNIDGCRIGNDLVATQPGDKFKGHGIYGTYGTCEGSLHEGRWPANVLLDEEAAALLDEQTGNVGGGFGRAGGNVNRAATAPGLFLPNRGNAFGYGDQGGASRFFYVAKASRNEREAGCEHLPGVRRTDGRSSEHHVPHLRTTERRNHHPTVKPIALMRHLCRLVTPPNGVVLDPFCGSGSTGCAAVLEGFQFVGIEREPEYVEIAKARIAHWLKLAAEGRTDDDEEVA